MLRTLTIRDFVIVERLDLEFQPGFTVLTGETGAGKSILIDALAFVLGSRAEALAVREGSEKAEVAAEFEIERGGVVAAYLAANDLAEGDECLMRRVVDSAGRSRAYVNGRPATAQQLREIGEGLVDVHGQHAHQSLLRPASQRGLLDDYAGAGELTGEVGSAWRAWQSAVQARQAAETNAAAMQREREQLEWQVKELDALHFQVDEWQALEDEQRRLAHASTLIEGVVSALQALSEDEQSVLATLAGTRSRLTVLTDYDPALKEALEVLEPAAIQVQEAVYSLRHYQQRLELDPQRLREVETRIDAVHTAARKYRTQPEGLPALLNAARERLSELDTSLDAPAAARREAELRSAYEQLAGRLTAARRKAALELSEQVTEAMQKLAMRGARFEVALAELPNGGAFGSEQIEFQVASHAAGGARPLAKVASGGELSRVSLAIQTVTSRVARVPTLIFDEVDAGIGGGVAEVVGQMLKALGRRHQIMCVTHLPQVAAAADHQWRVSKRSAGGRPASEVTVLDRDSRIAEIARMLGGLKISETTRRHAEEMLGTAAPARRKA